jgi:hypothetical protein
MLLLWAIFAAESVWITMCAWYVEQVRRCMHRSKMGGELGQLRWAASQHTLQQR